MWIIENNDLTNNSISTRFTNIRKGYKKHKYICHMNPPKWKCLSRNFAEHVAKGIYKCQAKQQDDWIFKWIPNRCSHNHISVQDNIKGQISDKLRPRWSQAREPRGTGNSTKKYNTVHPSYNLVFVLKANSHMDTPERESENMPHQVTHIV